MTRTVSLALAVLLTLFCLVACTPDSNDPFPSDAYTPWGVGAVQSADTFDDAVTDHEADGTVYQLVIDQTYESGTGAVWNRRHIYRYDHFPTYSNETQEDEPVWFRGHTALYLFDSTSTELPLPMEDMLVNITEPGIYGLLEQYVFPLSFVPATQDTANHNHTVLFLARDREGAETSYTIYRDGSVIRNENDVAQELLAEDVTALFFAAKYAHNHAALKHHTYAYADSDFEEFGIGVVRVTVRQGEQEWTLTEAESQDFLALLSDQPGAEDDFADYSFRCFIRSNGSVEDLGEPVLEFTLARVSQDGTTRPIRTYTLYSNGQVASKYAYTFGEYQDNSIPTLDRILIDRWLVSRTAFEVSPVLSFLDSLSQQSEHDSNPS